MPSAFVIAAPHSGAGKTSVVLGLMAAFRQRGLTVQSFKVGPDYLDPQHHARITGRPCHNLDGWMLPRERNLEIFTRAAAGAEVCLVEGVMGLHDGIDGRSPAGSTAELAGCLGLPVVLVVDARAMGRTAAAIVQGLAGFDPKVKIAGVLWNRVGSPSHRRILDEALESVGLPPALGALPRDATIQLPERHLGLTTPEDAGMEEDFADRLARWIESGVDLERLLRATRIVIPPASPDLISAAPVTTTKRRIAVALDAAFSFYYEANLRLLESAGARLVAFRPTDGEGIPTGVDGLYLGGGYPEMHAPELSGNEAFLRGLRDLHARGVPIYAECGGFMTLCRDLEDLDGGRWPMAGLFPVSAHMGRGRFRLGYRQVQGTGHPALAGLVLRGHEFHYSHTDPMPIEVPRCYRVANARGEELEDEGYCLGNTLAGYHHLHFGSCPEFPRRWFRLGETPATQRKGHAAGPHT